MWVPCLFLYFLWGRERWLLLFMEIILGWNVLSKQLLSVHLLSLLLHSSSYPPYQTSGSSMSAHYSTSSTCSVRFVMCFLGWHLCITVTLPVLGCLFSGLQFDVGNTVLFLVPDQKIWHCSSNVPTVALQWPLWTLNLLSPHSSFCGFHWQAVIQGRDLWSHLLSD